MQNIYLVGFMATGKTSAGKSLARRLGRQFIDLDDLIEQKAGKRIVDIFKDDGEPAFRKLEKETVGEASKKSDLVIGCGGGLVVDPDNLSLLKESGSVVCLSASVDVILSRSKGIDQRPLLNVSDPKARALELLSKREPFYSKAHFTIDTSDLTIDQVVDKICQLTGVK